MRLSKPLPVSLLAGVAVDSTFLLLDDKFAVVLVDTRYCRKLSNFGFTILSASSLDAASTASCTVEMVSNGGIDVTSIIVGNAATRKRVANTRKHRARGKIRYERRKIRCETNKLLYIGLEWALHAHVPDVWNSSNTANSIGAFNDFIVNILEVKVKSVLI